MEIKTLSSAISELGFPIVASLFLGIILYKLGSYLLKMANTLFGSQQKDRLKAIESIKFEVKDDIKNLRISQAEEINEIQKQFESISTNLIRLIDRIRLLSTSVYDLDVSSRIYFGMPKKNEHPKTTAEKREELQDQLNELNPKNGNH